MSGIHPNQNIFKKEPAVEIPTYGNSESYVSILWRLGIQNLYSCGQKLTYIHHWHECHGNFGLLMISWNLFFQYEMTVHTSLMALKTNNWFHWFKLFWDLL